MARRLYVATLWKLTLALCKYISIGTPIIERTYPTNSALLAALAAASAACAVLHTELDAVREYGD